MPVPTVRFVLAEDDGLGAGYVMSHVEGETIPRRILRDESLAPARQRMARQAGQIAARIHAVPLDEVGELPGFDGYDHPARAEIAQNRELLDAYGEPHPAFELALRWLEERLPPFEEATLVHGDFRNGNLVVGEDGIRAVLGREVDLEAMRFWEVLGTVRWGVICIVQAFTHLHGLHRSVELAAIGRRVCEMEHHVLEMID